MSNKKYYSQRQQRGLGNMADAGGISEQIHVQIVGIQFRQMNIGENIKVFKKMYKMELSAYSQRLCGV
mgnify:CR=1 FL=1